MLATMQKVAKATALSVSAPLSTPFRIASGQHNQMENVFLRVELENGIRGFGEAAVATHITGETIPQTLKNLELAGSALIGEDLSDPIDVISRFRPRFAGNHAALAAFEMAVLDVVAKCQGVPLMGLFQPPQGFGAKTSFNTDITIVIGSLAEAEEAAEHYATLGFRAFKIKIGRDASLDLERIRAVHRIAPGSSLILDANMGFSADSTLALLDQLVGYGIKIDLLEQPVPKTDWDGLARITREAAPLGTLVCADESVGSLTDAEKAISLGAVSAINIKFMKTGIIESAEIANLACRNGISLMLGAMMESGLAITASANFAAALGCFDFIDLDTTFFIKGPFAHSPYLSPDGRFDLSNPLPGIGLEPPLP